MNTFMKCCYTAIILVAVHANLYAQASPSISRSDLKREGVLTYSIIKTAHNTFYYDIFKDGKLLIHQPNIPAVPGNKAFARKSDAEKVAKLVIEKIRAGIMPPTLHMRDLEELRIKY